MLLQKCHDEAKALLEENREMLDKIASYLSRVRISVRMSSLLMRNFSSSGRWRV